jgi:hypothetical protein
MANNQRLSEEVQRFIVQSLACFETPTEVVNAVKERFGIEMDRQSVAHYSGVEAAKQWKAIFAETRKAYLEQEADCAIAQRPFRLRELEKLYQRAKRRGNDKQAADFLKQAAEEVGGSFTNTRAFTGPGGAPLNAQPLEIRIVGEDGDPNPPAAG